MGKISQHFDKLSKQWSLKAAIVMVVVSSFWCCTGFFQIVKYVKCSDSVGVLLGVFGVIIGFSGILFGSLMIHAVVRRLLAAPLVEP